jgi:hypothetical protein
MKARPILFSGPMIRALLEGRKTQTRRVVTQRLNPHEFLGGIGDDVNDPANWGCESQHRPSTYVTLHRQRCPYGKPGDLLWVRETWISGYDFFGPEKTFYRADHQDCQRCATGEHAWKPSIHMFRRASRLTLEITDVRVERLQDMPLSDYEAEGIVLNDEAIPTNEAVARFSDLWQSINGKGSWDVNPFVWALTFRVHHCNVDELLRQREAA